MTGWSSTQLLRFGFDAIEARRGATIVQIAAPEQRSDPILIISVFGSRPAGGAQRFGPGQGREANYLSWPPVNAAIARLDGGGLAGP